MPFSELFRLPKGKFDSTQDKNTNTCSNYPSFVPENDFVDIVWENGQISMSSRRTRKVPATRKYGKFGTLDYEFRTPEVSKEMGSNEDDNIVPGLIDESLRHGSCSDFISGVTGNQVSGQNHVSSIGKRTSGYLTIRSNTGSVHNESASFPSLRSKVQDSICNNKQDVVPPSTSSVSMNFPLFSVPAALGELGVRPPGKDKECAESTSPSCGPVSAPEEVNLRPREDMAVEEPVGTKGCQENTLKPGGAMDVVACSSVCSGSSIEKPSDGDLKRKSEDSEWPSEEESMDLRRAARARSSKRSRAAQVHNLSERVRRDRINEKMRALQELVPNCNKSDKASMLDEAIEYLKTLQLQVQMMSMGGGLYMPLMMMQHLHAASMVGMGMNYGIGVPDMIGGSSGCPMIQGGHFPMFGSSANLQLLNPPTLGLPMPTPPFAFNAQAMPNGGLNSSMNQTCQVKRDGPYRTC